MKQPAQRIATALLGAGAALSISACAIIPQNAPEGPATASTVDEHRIVVDAARAQLAVPVAPRATSLSHESRAEIARFAQIYTRAGHGPLLLNIPSGSDNADAAATLAHETRMRLTEAGVPYAAIAGSTYDAEGAPDASIVLTFTQYNATAPDCAPIWSQDLAHPSNNQPYASFGCATTANLAAMIEDPRDLLEPRAEGDRDASRRADVLQAYRRGEPTAVVRTQDERVTISNAVQ